MRQTSRKRGQRTDGDSAPGLRPDSLNTSDTETQVSEACHTDGANDVSGRRHVLDLDDYSQLEIEDRIRVGYQSDDDESLQAISEWSASICGETLADELSVGEAIEGVEGAEAAGGGVIGASRKLLHHYPASRVNA